MTSPASAQLSAELLIQSVTDYAIYMLDAQGIVISWNAGAERFKGYTAQEIIGQHFSNFYTEEDLEARIPDIALATAATEGRFEAQGWRVRKDRSRFWANVVIDPIRGDGGELIGFAKVTRDLTDRRRAEEELRRSEERFRLLVEGVTDYAIYMLDPDGKITSWNAGAQRFKGYTAKEIIGRNLSTFYTPQDIAAGYPARALKVAVDKGHFEAEGWRVRKDGSQFWANVVIDPIRNTAGELIGFAKVTRDLTERREAQLALEQSQEAFFHSQKLEAIGRLTGGVAHDFNNLLSAILGSLTLAEKRLAKGEDVTQFLTNAKDAAQRGATLTQRMLSFARKQELKFGAVDLAACIEGMTELLKHTVGPDVGIITDISASLPQVRADPAQLELALLNLAVNARDATPRGGIIWIEATQGSGANKNLVGVSVRDEGSGMDAETVAQAIEPFFTTKGVGKGTGLGLSMVQGMTEQSNGRFELASTPGNGTTATIWLPLADQSESRSIEHDADAQGESGTSERLHVLAVDDDAIVLMNTVLTLEDEGHLVSQAGSGAEALRIFEAEKIDLIITDFAMPEMNGAELIGCARSIRPGIHAIILSGYVDLPGGQTLDVPRLAKPFTEQELIAAIAAVRAT